MKQKSVWFCLVLYVFNFCMSTGCFAAETPEQIHQEVKSILSNPEFAPPVKSQNILARPLQTIQSWLDSIGNVIHAKGRSLQNILERWWKYLKKFFPHSKNVGLRGLVSRDMVFALVITLIIIGVVILVIILFRMRNKNRKSKPKSVSIELEEEDVENPDAGKWLDKAQNLVEMDDYRGAYRATFIAILSLLHEKQQLHLELSRSNGEYVREVRQKSKHEIYLQMKDAADDFDLRWYGHRPIRNSELEYLDGIYKSLAQELSYDTSTLEMVG